MLQPKKKSWYSLAAILAVVALAISSTSCGSIHDEPSFSPLVGSWACQNYDGYSSYTFYPDGTGSYTLIDYWGRYDTWDFDWWTRRGVLYIDFWSGESWSFYYRVSGDVLTLDDGYDVMYYYWN